MTVSVWHDPQADMRFMAPGVGTLSVTDLPEVHQVAPQHYQMWQEWRYENLSMKFHESVHQFAQREWERKRPWWLGPR